MLPFPVIQPCGLIPWPLFGETFQRRSWHGGPAETIVRAVTRTARVQGLPPQAVLGFPEFDGTPQSIKPIAKCLSLARV